MKKEIWKDKKDYEGHYQVSNWGRAKSIKFGKEQILKPVTDKDGYLQVNLWKNNKPKRCRIHRLVAEVFLEIPEELKHLKGTRYLQVNHKDENKLNNNAENLEWCSAKYNSNFGTRNKRIIAKNTNGKRSKKVYQYTLDGQFVREWDSIRECGRNGFNPTCICMCCRGKQKYHKGFIWKCP